MSAVLIYIDKEIDYVFDEIYIANSTIDSFCDAILSKIKRTKSNVYFTGDPTGKNRSLYSPYGNFEEVKKRVPNIKITIPSIMRVVDSLNMVNGRFCNAEKKSKVFVDNKCTNLIKDFERVQRLPDGSIDKKSDLSISHIGDSYRYFCSAFRQGNRYGKV
jgi:hypothetical protein